MPDSIAPGARTFRDDLSDFYSMIGKKSFWARGEQHTQNAFTGLAFSYLKQGNPETDAVFFEAATYEFNRRGMYAIAAGLMPPAP